MSALPLIEQVLVASPPSIVFVAFAAVLTGSFNTRLALLNEAWGANIGTLAQKKAYLNAPTTKIKDNIRKRHERYIRNLEFSTRTIRKHLEMIRAGAYMVLISFLLYVISTMLNILKPYEIMLAYPATVILWAAMLLDIIAVLLIFIDLWTSYSHLRNENQLLYKIKKMIIEDFRATGQLPAENGTQMEEHKPDADEASLHDEINELVLKNAQFGPEAENELNMQKAEVAMTVKGIPANGEQKSIQGQNGDAVEEESSDNTTSSQSSSEVKQEQIEKPADSDSTSSSEQLSSRASDKVSRSSSSSKSSSSNSTSRSSQEESEDSSN